MARTLVVSRNFNADADGSFPAGFTDLNSYNGVVAVANVSGTAGLFRNNYGNPADARDTGTFTADQYAKITVSGFTGSNANDQVGVCLRLGTATVGGAGVNGYRIKVTDGGVGARTIRAYSVVNDTETQIGSTATLALADGDTVAGEIIGTSLTVYHNDAPVAGLTSVATTTHATGNPGIMASLGNNGTIRGDNYEAGNVTPGGGSSDLSGNADLGGMSAGGTLATNPPTDLSGGGTLDSVSASGTLAQSPATSLSGGATLDGVTAASGNLGQAGTVTSQPLKRNNGTLVVSQALTWVGFRNATTGTDVVVRTGISTNALGVFSVSDGLLQPGTTYAVQWRESSGHHGEAHAVAV